MEEYEDIWQEKNEAQNSKNENKINTLLDNLDSRGQQEIAYGYDLFELGSTTQNLLYLNPILRIHSLKSAISSMLGAVGDGEEVTAEHVAVFKRKLEADIEERKKRRRLDA